jgi:hypothetical protein
VLDRLWKDNQLKIIKRVQQIMYLRSTGNAFCNFREKPLNCFPAPGVVLGAISSMDSDRFLFAGADEDVDKSLCGKIESPFKVFIAGRALMRVVPALDVNFNQLFQPMIAASYATGTDLPKLAVSTGFAADKLQKM